MAFSTALSMPRFKAMGLAPAATVLTPSRKMACASTVMVGEPNFLSRTTLRPLGPSVILTASASWLTPRRIAARDSSPCITCFAINVSSPSISRLQRFFTREKAAESLRLLAALLAAGRAGALDDAEDFVLAHDEVLLAVDLYLRAAVLAEEHAVASLYVERDARA